jgi:hypothetical protein
MPVAQTAAVANNVVALARESTATLKLDDIVGYNALVSRTEVKRVIPYWKDIDIMAALDFSNQVQTTTETVYKNYEAGAFFRLVTPLVVTGATSTASSGGTVTMTLTNGSYSSRSTSATQGTSALYTSLMKNDWFRTYDGQVGFVQAKTGTGTATIFTIERARTNTRDLAASLNYHATNNLPISVLGNIFSEGSLQPLEGLSRGTMFHINNTSIVKTHRAVTNTANASYLITERGEERPIKTQEVEMGMEHRIKEAMLLWWGTGEDWTDPSENIPTVKMTKGVDGSTRERGNLYQFSTTVGYLEADFDAQVEQFEAVHGGNEVRIFAGSYMYGALQAIFKAKVAGMPAAVYTFQSFGASNGKQKAADIGFNSVVIRGITFHLLRSDLFRIPEMTDILGYNYKYMAYWIPGEMQMVDGNFVSNGNEVTKTPIPTLAAVYTTQQDDDMDGQRRYLYWKRGVRITNRDETQQEMLTEVGAKISMVRKFMLTEGI